MTRRLFSALAATALAASVGGVEVLRATASGGLTLGGAPGGHALEVVTPASAANRVVVNGAAAGAPVSVQAQGADASIGELVRLLCAAELAGARVRVSLNPDLSRTLKDLQQAGPAALAGLQRLAALVEVGERADQFVARARSGQIAGRIRVIGAQEGAAIERDLAGTAAVAGTHYGSSDPTSAAYNEGANWVGVLFAAYNGFAALAAVAIPWLAPRLGLRGTHMLNLCLGALGLLSFLWVRDPQWLLLSMVGVGFAWASILSLPYAMLSDNLPAAKMGVYMGIFNFFIVIPQLVAASLLVLTTGRQYCERFTERLPVEIMAVPIEFPALAYYQLWHARTQHSAAAAWLRDCVRSVADTLPKR